MKYFIAVLIVLVSIIFIFLPRFIFIEKIYCKTQYGPCRQSLNEKLDLWNGKNLSEVKKGVSDYLSKDLLVSKYSIRFMFPNMIVVNLIEKAPRYALTNVGRNDYFLVDKNGYIVEVSSFTNLPVLIVDNLPKVGEVVEENILFALNIISDIYSLYQISYGEIKNNDLYIKMPGEILAIFPLRGDRKVLVGSLQMIFYKLNTSREEFKIENIKEIDLRFKNPIIR